MVIKERKHEIVVEAGDIIKHNNKQYIAINAEPGQRCQDCALFTPSYKYCKALDCSILDPNGTSVIFKLLK